jgi:hypothetical protein
VSGVWYPGYRGSLVITQNSGYDRFPLATNNWGTIYDRLKRRGHQPKKNKLRG